MMHSSASNRPAANTTVKTVRFADDPVLVPTLPPRPHRPAPQNAGRAPAAPHVRAASPDSIHAMTVVGQGQVARPVPQARRVPQGARQPIEPPTVDHHFSKTANTLDRRRWDAQLEQRRPQPGLQACLPTAVLEPPTPAPRLTRALGAVRAGLDALRPAERRHINDSRSAAAWLRDNGEVGLGDDLRDVVLHTPRDGSRRLERLGFLEAHPNLNENHAAAVQRVLVRRYERQSSQGDEGAAKEESLTRELRRVLPQANRRR